MNNDIYVLGTHTSHNGSACLLKNGQIAVAIEKERLTRIKHHGKLDNEAIQYCLEAEGITLDQVDLIVQNDFLTDFEFGFDQPHGRRIFSEQPASKIKSISHHLAHAYSAIGLCPFEEFNIFITDSQGNSFDLCVDTNEQVILNENLKRFKDLGHLYYEKDSFYGYTNAECKTIAKDFSPVGKQDSVLPHPPTLHSIGGLYGKVASYCCGGSASSGKLMGLAPYGRPGAIQENMFRLEGGRVFVNYDWMKNHTLPVLSPKDFQNRFQYFADLALCMQKQTEAALLYVIEHRQNLQPGKNLCFAGGTALNCVANTRIANETSIENLFVVPAARDSGIALGCAFYGWLEVLKRPRVMHNGRVGLGRHYSNNKIQETLNSWKKNLKPQTEAAQKFITSLSSESNRIVDRDQMQHIFEFYYLSQLNYGTNPGTKPIQIKFEYYEEITTKAAQLLADGNYLGWFQGGSEFGPRALGHRSILADARNPKARNFINQQIKFREDFRPFAPAVLKEDAASYFRIGHNTPYMTFVDFIKPEWSAMLSSVVHEDGSCRVQTVTNDWNPLFYDLLKSFKQLTGIPILLNTSLNCKGMPIVESPLHALDFFSDCELDYLVIGNYLVSKQQDD